MNRYIRISVTILILGTAFFSFKPGGSKLGPHLKAALENSNRVNFTVWIYFSDKGADKLQNPLSLVTQRSLTRRAKVKSYGNLVSYNDLPVNNTYANRISQSVLKFRNASKWLNAVCVEADKDQIASISNYDFVSKVEIAEYRKFRCGNEIISEQEDALKNFRPYYSDTDTFDYGGNSASLQIRQIKVNQVHNQSDYGQNIMIADFDAGFSNLTHEVFTTYPMKITSTYDFHNHSIYLDPDPHGTATLSLAGGFKPGNMVSPAFASEYILARTEVQSSETPAEMDNWIAAAEWADSLGADVITSSLNYLYFDPPNNIYTWHDMNGNTLPITIAADIAAGNGIIVVNAAGNHNYDTVNTLSGPADGDSVFTIGAVDYNNNRADFSSVGPTTDVPPRFKPDFMAYGTGAFFAGIVGNDYLEGDGTSYSTPLAAGVCALTLAANKNLTPMQVRGIMRKFASNPNAPNNLIGWGIPNAQLMVDSARKLDNMPPTIFHVQPFTETVNTGAITMRARFFDNGIIRLWQNQAPMIYFRKSTNGGGNWSAYTAVTANTVSADTFSFQISGSAIGTTVEYYFAAQDIALPNSLMATLPSGGSGINPPGTIAPSSRFSFYVGVIGIQPIGSAIPKEFKLYNNYPNPFNPETKIRFDIPQNVKQQTADVKLIIFDVLAREVATLVNQQLQPGKYEVSFDASNYPSGVYFYRMQAGNYIETRKMILIK